MDENNAVGAVEKPIVVATVETGEVDYEAQLAAKDAEIAKAKEISENYRKGMLKAKGKLPVEEETYGGEEEKPDIAAMVADQVKYQLAQSTEAKLLAEKDALAKGLAQKVKELTITLKNKDQSAASGQGGNTEGREVGDNFFSAEQLATLKAKGWDDKKIAKLKENMLSAGTLPPPPISQ
jgi:hypothetical protein